MCCIILGIAAATATYANLTSQVLRVRGCQGAAAGRPHSHLHNQMPYCWGAQRQGPSAQTPGLGHIHISRKGNFARALMPALMRKTGKVQVLPKTKGRNSYSQSS